MRLLFTLQYLGTHYGGWQLQTNTPSVQQVVEDALGRMFQQNIRLHGAGRTDAGVHAEAQRAHADVPFEIPTRGLLLGINQLLPHDIRVTAVETVADDFHARFDAKGKTYAYRIWNGEVANVFAGETHAHVTQPLDVAVMHDAAQALIGTHDFKVFTVADPEVSSTVRTIDAISVVREGERITLTVSADGFLRSMVRRIAGSLIEIGRGKMVKDRLFAEARWTAPAKGLVLLEVRY
jgi:tRNA pseudouridine38-40 synthase